MASNDVYLTGICLYLAALTAIGFVLKARAKTRAAAEYQAFAAASGAALTAPSDVVQELKEISRELAAIRGVLEHSFARVDERGMFFEPRAKEPEQTRVGPMRGPVPYLSVVQ